jgi:asparagine synthase (glutamine-hydrolysing)
VAFASELRALLAAKLVGTPHLDPQAVASGVWNGFVVGPGTAVKGIDLLWPGRLIELDGAGKELRQEDFSPIPHRAPDPTMDEDGLAAVLQEDLRLHLASDVFPRGLPLPRGWTRRPWPTSPSARQSPIHTFTLAFEEQELNEGPIAENRSPPPLERSITRLCSLRSALSRSWRRRWTSLDQPTFDGLNAYYMSRAIRAAGFTVALSGMGGDRLFGGYKSYRELPVLQRWSRRTAWVPRGLQVAAAKFASRLLGRSSESMPPQTRWAKLPEMVRHGEDLLALYQLAYALFLPGFQRELLAPGFAEALADGLPPAMRPRISAETRARTPLSAIGVMEQRLFLRRTAAARQRRGQHGLLAGAAGAAGGPDPFRERGPAAGSGALPASGPQGHVAAHWPARPPSRAVRATQSGFVLPFDRWIRRGLKDAMDQTLRDPQAIAPAGLDLWRWSGSGASLSGRGAGHVLVTSVVRLRLHPMVPPQPCLPLRRRAVAPWSYLNAHSLQCGCPAFVMPRHLDPMDQGNGIRVAAPERRVVAHIGP